MPAKPSIRFQRNLIDHRPMIPRRVRQHMLQLLFIRTRNPFLHPFHILFVRIRLHQATQIVSDRLDHVARCVLKVRFEAQMETGESPGKPIK